MAGGRGNSKQIGHTNRTDRWLSHHHLHNYITPESFFGERFKKRESIEWKHTATKTYAEFHENILRVYTDSLFCDFNIINGHNVIQTNQCIVRTRSPHFYEALEPYFVHTNQIIDCIIDTPGLFQQIKRFVRLLYENVDLLRDEQLLVQTITNVLFAPQSIDIYKSNDTAEDIDRSQPDIVVARNLRNIERYAAKDLSPTSSDMADSGLETGSVSPHENTNSENSSTDLEESQTAENACPTEDIARIQLRRKREKIHKPCTSSEYCDTSSNCSGYGTRDLADHLLTECTSNDHSGTCSSVEVEQHPLDSSSSSNENAQKTKAQAEEIYQYENQVLSDPFYESDCASDENESFEFVNPSNISSLSTDPERDAAKVEQLEEKPDEKSCAESSRDKDETEVTTREAPQPAPTQSNVTAASSSYYFIDASTLNDEVDVLATNRSKDSCVPTSQSYAPYSIEYTPSRSSNVADEQCYRYTAFKSTNRQSGHERVAEFERELKLTEYLKPLSESRRVKRVDSGSEEKTDADKATEKESLVVEIKEADSGESTQHSPCPDNNANIVNKRSEVSKETNDSNSSVETVDGVLDDKNSNVFAENEACSTEARRPSLIRGNTFELDSNDEKLSFLRQEYERRQGSLVFQNSIPQYSGHRVDGDSCFDPCENSSLPPANEMLNTFPSDFSVPVSAQYHAPPCLSLDSSKSDVAKKQPEISYLTESELAIPSVSYPVAKSASDKLVMDPCLDVDEASESYSNSLPVTLSSIIEKDKRFDTTKRTKRDEATPIISGGASTSDFTKPTDSPIVRRKTESTPIVSGGSVIMNEPDVRVKPSRMSSSMTAWVVDMSDCAKSEPKTTTLSNSSGMSQSFSTSECLRKPVRKTSSQEKQNSLGFFVNLKDMDAKKDTQTQKPSVERKEQNGNSKPYCEFYVDVSNRNGAAKSKRSENVDENNKAESVAERADKKNIFSMFIDLSDTPKTRENNSVAVQRKNLSSFAEKRADAKLEETNSSETSSTTLDDQSAPDAKSSKEKTKASVFMFIESDSPVVRRRTLSSSRPAFNRHSWNIDKSQSSNGHVAKELMFRKEHKRAHSLSVDCGDLKKLQAKTSSSNHSLSEAARTESVNHKSPNALQEQEGSRAGNMDTSTEDVFEFDARDTPPNSHIEVINEELRVSVRRHDYKELTHSETAENVAEGSEGKAYEDEFSETSAWEKTCTESTEGQTRKSETFDISSGSGPSTGSDNHDFELSDLLSQRATSKERSKPATAVGSKISETHKSLNETIKKIESELEGPEYAMEETYKSHVTKVDDRLTSKGSDPGTASCSFVRLSDLDSTSRIGHVSDIITAKEEKASYRMSNSIPETSWIESKLVMTRGNGPIRAIPRKFTSIMSTSLPPKQKSPLEDLTGEGEAEGIISESDLSSMQSSMGRSGAEGSTEETETSSLAGGKPYNRLGEDLLRMFLEEINPDVTIDVGGRRIRAHKCILSSRCQYFAAILSGSWVENAGNVISLQGYSYNAVHFALCHIYSGESNIPDSISIVELATLADMLCLEGLKEVIGYTLKVKYCHLFHKPCQICAVGVLECMPLAAAYGLDEVYRKSLRWITRHFVRIWPSKAFATLPRELMEKCYHQHIVHMSTDNVLQTMMDCDKLLATLPNVHWVEPVFRMVSNLLETAMKFLSDNFASVLGNEYFQLLGRELTWNISRLEDNFLAAAERLPPEQACKSYSKLHKMIPSTELEDSQMKAKWEPLFVDFLNKIQRRVEKCLVRDAARAARTTTWLKMDLELRRRIQKLACLVILPHETTKRPSRHSNFLKEPKAASNRSTASRSLDLKRVKMAISEHNDRTLKQTNVVQQPKKPLNKPKSDPLERKVQEEKQTTSEPAIRPKSWPNKIEVKSRYLEPRKPAVKETTPQVPSEKVSMPQRRKIMISSSDSSRTSSPAMKRATDKKPLAKMKLPVKKDVKALSSDSLTESTMKKSNSKKDILSKSCGITRPESPSFKQKTTEMGLSVDSLAESKKKPVVVKKKATKMDTSMSTDSLITEISATPKSSVSNKLSPTLSKGVAKMQIYDKTKKNSPPTQQRNPGNVTRKPLRTLESSTAASRSRAAAISAYHGSPSLRRNLLDAAKTPDIPSKANNAVSRLSSVRQSAQVASPLSKREKKDSPSNQQSSESPSKKSSPKSSAANRPNRTMTTTKRVTGRVPEEKVKTKCHNGDTPKQPTVGSRSGTFLKDEPTILKKADIKSAQISTA